MKVIAFQFWNQSWQREITIPPTGDLNTALNAAFKFGQNEVQPQKTPSVSVGDVLVLPEEFGDNRCHIVMPAGFMAVTDLKLALYRLQE